MNLQEQRTRALDVIVKQGEQGVAQPIDYVIDDECRRLLNLPPRPVGSLPYVGWMVGTAKPESSKLTISDAGIAHIKRWEGCRTNAYLCPAKVWTIGYGHTKTAKPGMMISHLEAENLLRQDLERFEDAVRDYVRVPLTQGQYDALVSFAFNVGIGAFQKSTLLKLLNKGQYNTAALQFSQWVYAGKRKLEGLVNRRNEEYRMFTGR